MKAELEIIGASLHNLKDITCRFPLHRFSLVLGPSGAGKSSLIFGTLFEQVRRSYELFYGDRADWLQSLQQEARSGAGAAVIQGAPFPIPSRGIDARISHGTVLEFLGLARVVADAVATFAHFHCRHCSSVVEPAPEGDDFEASMGFAQTKRAFFVLGPCEERTAVSLWEWGQREGIVRVFIWDQLLRLSEISQAEASDLQGLVLDVFDPTGFASGAPLFDEQRRFAEAEVVARRLGANLSVVEVRGSDVVELARRRLSPRCGTCGKAFKRPNAVVCRSVIADTLRSRRSQGLGLQRSDFVTDEQRLVLGGAIGGKTVEASLTQELTAWDGIFAMLAAERKFVVTPSLQEAHELDADLIRFNDIIHQLVTLGMGHLSLDRLVRTLSRGELRRLELIRALYSALHGSLFLCDEPSLGLHILDVERLGALFQGLCRDGSTVIAIDHHERLRDASDYELQLGPGAGPDGGSITYQGPTLPSTASARRDGTLQDLDSSRACTRWLGGDDAEAGADAAYISLEGATLHNLRDIAVKLPIGALIGVGGVSGSGKSSFVFHCLVPSVRHALRKAQPVPEAKLQRKLSAKFPGVGIRKHVAQQILPVVGVERLGGVIALEPARETYNKRSTVWSALGLGPALRELYANTIAAQVLGLQPRDLRETHSGPDWTEKLRYRGYSLRDVHGLTVSEMLSLFSRHRRLARPLAVLEELGLGYVVVRQLISTLSRGELQRLHLARALWRLTHAKFRVRSRLIVLDEPSRGLNRQERVKLIELFRKLIGQGHTVVVIEHAVDVLEECDAIMEFGPGAGKAGGKLLTEQESLLREHLNQIGA